MKGYHRKGGQTLKQNIFFSSKVRGEFLAYVYQILLVCFKWNERRYVPLPISPTRSLHILDPQEKEAGSAERDLPKLLSAP